MRRFISFTILLILSGMWMTPVLAHNPFTNKPETQHKAPEPPVKSEFFVKIIVWQHKLKQRMSDLIRDFQKNGNMKPLLFLIGIAFAYGVIHAAGPGHGKVVATSYVMSYKTSIINGLFLGLFIGIIHGFSGAAGVLGLRYIIQKSVSETLTATTMATQLVSYGLITILGLIILIKNSYILFLSKKNGHGLKTVKPSRKNLLPWAAAVGLIPCPAVVMVMLFCISMDVLLLGIILAASISLGMAMTIACLVIIVILGKSGVLNLIPGKHSRTTEISVGMASGGIITVFGLLLFYTTIISVFY